MMSAAQPGPPPAARLVAIALAAGVPFACYLATASAHGYWLDGGEFVATSISLGIAHPPGHPLAALVGHAASLVPLGPLSLRVALASAAACALAASFVYVALETTILALGLRRPLLTIPIALGGTWLVATSYGWWLQAVRPEVYALQAALTFAAVERFVAIEGRAPVYDLRPLYAGLLSLGLALANHHFLAFLVLPALAPTMARVYRGRGLTPFAWSAGALGVGLLTYVYLPLRAAAGAEPSLGEPTSLGRLWWVVSAQAFQKSTDHSSQPLWERFADAAVHAVVDLHWATVLLAVGGLYVAMRLPAGRRVGFIWAALVVLYGAGRAWLGFIRANPDALGYLMPADAALVALAVCFVAAILGSLGSMRSLGPRALAVTLAFAVAALGLARLPSTAARASLAHFAATDAFDDFLRRDVPPKAVILVHGPHTVFRLWGGEALEHLRPDLVPVPMPFVTYPGMVGELVDREPDLAEVLRGYLLEGELRQPDLQSLAARRPLLVEMDPRVPPSLYETLVPKGLYYEVLADGATDADERLGARSQARAWTGLYGRLGPADLERRTRDQLLWRHYNDALYYAGFGDRENAREAVRRGLAINPRAEELRALANALEGEHEEGPIDIAPFMVGAERP